MKAEEIESHVDAVLERAFVAIKSAYDFQREESPAAGSQAGKTRIIFPKYGEHRQSDECDRMSDQEMRFIFFEQLNKYLDEKGLECYYSVETPAESAYNFSGGSQERSGSMTLSIHDNNLKRRCLIEFRALNPAEYDCEKDMLKLKDEPCEVKYFIQIIRDADDETIKSLKEKTRAMQGSGIHYRCYCLGTGERLKEAELN